MIPALILAVAAFALGVVLILLIRASVRELRLAGDAHALELRLELANGRGELEGFADAQTFRIAALESALDRFADELRAQREQHLVGKTVTVHTTDGQSLRGVVACELEDGTLDLRGAAYRQPDGSSVELDGVQRVTGARRSWLQIVEG